MESHWNHNGPQQQKFTDDMNYSIQKREGVVAYPIGGIEIRFWKNRSTANSIRVCLQTDPFGPKRVGLQAVGGPSIEESKYHQLSFRHFSATGFLLRTVAETNIKEPASIIVFDFWSLLLSSPRL